jgi:serine O-acetyltransferase
MSKAAPAKHTPPSKKQRRELMRKFRRKFPSFRRAVSEDVRIYCMFRGERSELRNVADLAWQVLRLSWKTDAFFALFLYRLKATLQVHEVPVIPSLLHRAAMITGQVCIGDPVIVAPGIYLPHGSVVIDGIVEIGPGVEVRPWVTIGLKEGNVNGAKIGAAAHIGTGAKVIGPVKIGRGAIIGANAVVVKDVEPGATVAGVPARPIGR